MFLLNSDHKLHVFYIQFYNIMNNRKSNSSHIKSQQSNKHHPENPLYNLILQNYQRCHINTPMIHNINAFLLNLTLKITQQQQPTEKILKNQHIKTIVEFVTTFENNLIELQSTHSVTSQDILNFFKNLTSIFQSMAEYWKDYETLVSSDLINALSILLEKDIVEVRLPDFDKKFQTLSHLISAYQNCNDQEINYEAIIKENFLLIATKQQQQSQIRNLFISFLRVSNTNPNFKPLLLNYLNQCFLSHHLSHFKKAFAIYQHFGSNFQQRRGNIEIVMLKSLDHNHTLQYVHQINLSFSISKVVSPQNIPHFIIRILEKIIQSSIQHQKIILLLEQLSYLNISGLEKLADRPQLKCEGFLSKIVQWVVNLKHHPNEEIQQRPKILEPEMQKDKIIEFVKKLSNSKGLDGEESEQSKQEYQKICKFLTIILKKLASSKLFSSSFIDIDSFLPFKTDNIQNEALKQFLLDVIPYFVNDGWVLVKERTGIKCGIVVRSAEIYCQRNNLRQSGVKQYFLQSYFQMINPTSSNYHFILCYVFLKHYQDKEEICTFLIEEMIKDFQKQDQNKSNRNLILKLALLINLMNDYFHIKPIKFKIKQLLKKPDLLATPLSINHLINVYYKEVSILKHEKPRLAQKYYDFKERLNSCFESYKKDNLNVFYYLVMGVNQVMQQEGKETNQTLADIKFMKKVNLISQVYTIVRCFNEKVKEMLNKTHPLQTKKHLLFLIIMKFHYSLKNGAIMQPSQDLDTCFQFLRDLALIVTKIVDQTTINSIQSLKSNRQMFKEDKYLDFIKQKAFIKFYSQSCEKQTETHIIMARILLGLIKGILQVKAIPLRKIQPEFQYLYLLYSFDEKPLDLILTQQHEEMAKSYLLCLKTSLRLSQKSTITDLVVKIKENLKTFKEAVLQERSQLALLKQNYPVDFMQISINSIRSLFENFSLENLELFKLIIALIDQDNKENCSKFEDRLKEGLKRELSGSIFELLIKRIQMGIEIEQTSKVLFHNVSSLLYPLLKELLAEDISKLILLVQDIIQIDYYSDCVISAFILKEITYIFKHIPDKNPSICETIFNYILTLTDIFPGEQKLEISNFICNFFALNLNSSENDLQKIEKTMSYVCNNNLCNYKCLKCDDKKLMCYACAITCHKDHPVFFLNFPPEYKIARCQCKEVAGSQCKFVKQGQPNPNANLKLKSEYPRPLGAYASRFISSAGEFQRGPGSRYGLGSSGRYMREHLFDEPERIQINALIPQDDYDLEQEVRIGSRYYDHIPMKEQFYPRMAGRYDRAIDREQFLLSQGYKAYGQRIEQNRGGVFQQNKEKEVSKQEMSEPVEPQFIDQEYEQSSLKMEVQDISFNEEHPAIFRKYPLLPKFIDLIANFCTKAAQKNTTKVNLQTWKVQFTNPTPQKITQTNFKVYNPGTYHLQIRKQNPINNVSCVMIKKNLAQNNRFVVIASGTDMHVYLKEKLFLIASEMKNQSNFAPIHRHSVGYEIHSIEFSNNDKNLFCASGVYNLSLYSMNTQGIIAKTNHRYSVNNIYINKVKLAKIGIFVGVQKEIRVLNYTCKHFLTVKPQESNTLIRQWSVFEKSAGCQIYFACPNGNIFFTELMPSDQGKKEFTGKVTDQRKNKNNTGASIVIKELPQMGKFLFASFKDGSNILGPLDGDQMTDMTDIRLKGIKVNKNIFDSNFIMGHFDIVKLPEAEELYVVCTVKKYFPPEMSFHQGYLALIRIRKDGNSEIEIISDQSTCELFQVFYIGTKHFIILSLHTDGSMHLSSPTKIPRALVDEQIRKAKEIQSSGNGANENKSSNESTEKLRSVLLQQIDCNKMMRKIQNYSYNFRQNSDSLKIGSEYSLVKLSDTEYEFKQLRFNRIVVGISLPYFGNIELPTRTVNNVMELGLSNLEALWLFGKGSMKFKYTKSQNSKFVRENVSVNGSARILQKLQKMERLNDFFQDKIPIPGMINSLLGIKEDNNLQVQFISKSFEHFKSKIHKFNSSFSVQADDQANSIEKTALIIKMFLTKGLIQGQPCTKDEICSLIQALKTIISTLSKNIYKLIKQVIVLAVRTYQKITSSFLTLQNDENYPLRVATQNRLLYYINLLKVDISEEDLNDLLQLLTDIINEDLDLIAYYIAKYPFIIPQLHKRLKKPDNQERAEALVEIYAISYTVLKFCDHSCSWIITDICYIISTFFSSKNIRVKIYECLGKTKSWIPMGWLKNLKEGKEELEEINNLSENVMVDEVGAKDPMSQIYNMFNRGQIDEEALIRMIQQATKIQYDIIQDLHQKPNQEDMILQPEMQIMMEQAIHIKQEPNYSLITDIIEECTALHQNFEMVSARIMLLYVAARAIDKHFPEAIMLFLKKIKKMVSQVQIKMDNQKVVYLICFSSLYNHIMSTNKLLKDQQGRCTSLYKDIQKEVYDKLNKIEMEKVNKISNPLNYINKVFKAEKPNAQIHLAYALSNFLIYPCQPNHILLSLECYWLLPESKQYYAKQKSISMIRQGMNSGNILKVWQIAKEQSSIWQQSDEYIQVLERWIREKNANWQIALDLLALYYSD